jgi:hypothetical protein
MLIYILIAIGIIFIFIGGFKIIWFLGGLLLNLFIFIIKLIISFIGLIIIKLKNR